MPTGPSGGANRRSEVERNFYLAHLNSSGILTASINAGGSAYVVGDTLTITQGGGSNGQVSVTRVSGGGGVQGIRILTQGAGYTTANALATTGGSGTGATINITAAATVGATAQTPFRQLARQFYLSALSDPQYSIKTPFDQLKIAWAKSTITRMGGTPPPGNYWSDIIKQMCNLANLRTTDFVGDNETTFFLLGTP